MGLPEDTVLPIKEGVPDFERFTIDGRSHAYNGTLAGHHGSDRDLFLKDLAEKKWRGLDNVRAVEKELSKMNAHIHHGPTLPDGRDSYQLVKAAVHKAFGHDGTASKRRYNRP